MGAPAAMARKWPSRLNGSVAGCCVAGQRIFGAVTASMKMSRFASFRALLQRYRSKRVWEGVRGWLVPWGATEGLAVMVIRKFVSIGALPSSRGQAC
jgi:hypothetical protein